MKGIERSGLHVEVLGRGFAWLDTRKSEYGAYLLNVIEEFVR